MSIHEHIIIDGGSVDRTCAIVAEYMRLDDGIRKIFISEKDEGIYDAMNKGLERATGDYLWFLNSDDRLASEGVVRVVTEIIKNNPATMVAGATLVRDEVRPLRIYSAKKPNRCFIPQQPHPSLLVNAKFIISNQITFDSTKKIVSDYKMQLEIFKLGGSILVVDDILCEMYVGGVSNSSARNKIAGWFESYAAYKEVFGCGAFRNTLLKVATKLPQFFHRFVG